MGRRGPAEHGAGVRPPDPDAWWERWIDAAYLVALFGAASLLALYVAAVILERVETGGWW